MLATLLMAILAVGAGAGTAVAHGSHAQHVSISSVRTALSSQSTEIPPLTQRHAMAAEADTQNGVPDQHSKSDCCCGGIMCHAGVTLTVELFSFLSPTGGRLMAVPSSGRAQLNASGLERPPRTTDIA